MNLIKFYGIEFKEVITITFQQSKFKWTVNIERESPRKVKK